MAAAGSARRVYFRPEMDCAIAGSATPFKQQKHQ
jgi:hypothetical protein